jgi:ABC-2 type transport system permease protein
MKTVLSLYIASVKEFMRDRMAIFWTLAFPVLFIVLFGVIFAGGGSPSYTVGLVNEDGGPVSQGIVQAFKNVKPFTIKEGTRDDEMNALKKGQIDMVIVIPEGLSAGVASGQTAQVQMYYDPSANPTDAQIKLNIVQEVLSGINSGYVHTAPPLALDAETITTTKLRYVDFLVPGILAMSLMQLGLFATATPLVALRQEQVLRRLGATPLPRWQLLMSQVMLRLTIALAQTAVILGLGIAAFGVHIQGNPLMLAGLVLLGALTFIGIGYLIASIAKTVDSASGISSAVNFPMMFLSGIFFPLAALPAFLTPFVRALPLTYLGDAIRQVMNGSTPEFPMTVDVAVLAAWALGCALLSIRLFKWE